MQVTEDTKFIAGEVLDYLKRFPERHNQTNWVSGNDIENLATDNVCNSTMCVAGTAVFLTTSFSEFKDLALNHVEDITFEERGAELLGLDFIEANRLFYSDSEDEALELLNAIANGDELGFNEIGEE